MVVSRGAVIGIFYACRRTGPWKPVLGEGWARRGESVIVVKKIDVHVNSMGCLGICGQIGQNERS